MIFTRYLFQANFNIRVKLYIVTYEEQLHGCKDKPGIADEIRELG
jgi:hypothetical protein